MTDMLQGNSTHAAQSVDDPPYERRTPSKASPQRARAPSKRPHAQKATQQLAAQLWAESSVLPDQEAPATAAAQPTAQHAQHDQQADSLMSLGSEDWQSRRCAYILYMSHNLHDMP